MQNNTTIPDYSHYSKFELLKLVVTTRTRERETTADLVLALREFDRRKLYRDEGYTSLYAFCQEKLKLSEGASIRRPGVGQGEAVKSCTCPHVLANRNTYPVSLGSARVCRHSRTSSRC